ncbi:MAG: T9SS type A sorting domain-containing protein, partial [Chlamydiia bacterium]|nr:T9SS type A sorting domain-containing protein [Chlamydiia bacterium]
SEGNDNGRIDAGETFDIIMTVMNNGHAISPEGIALATSSSSYLTVNTASINVTPLDAAVSENLVYSMTASADAPEGSLVGVYFEYTAGSYSANTQINEAIGLILEDFETGDFTSFDWQFNNKPWEITTTTVYEGNNAAKSGNINDGESSIMELSYNVVSEGDLSFFYKVSSENNYDKLKFYINGSEKDAWSGDVDWTEASYVLSAGENILKWEYSKDGSAIGGEDCAWVDFIILPASTEGGLNASFTVDTDDICDGDMVSYTSTSTDATSWDWTFEGGDPATSTEENPTVTYPSAGEYDVIFTVSDGDTEVTSTLTNFMTVHNCTGVETVETASVKLYPNPNNGEFFIDIQGMDNANITILNSVGSLVYQENNITTDNSMKQINLSQQAEGIYMIIVENNDSRIIEKIIIK